MIEDNKSQDAYVKELEKKIELVKDVLTMIARQAPHSPKCEALHDSEMCVCWVGNCAYVREKL